MAAGTTGLGNHNLNTSSVKVLASDLAQRLNINIEYVFFC